MAWADQGIECYVCKKPKRGLKPLLDKQGKVICYVAPSKKDELKPLYHLHRKDGGDDLYSISEKDTSIYKKRKKWTLEKDVCYVMDHEDTKSGYSPLFRAYDPYLKIHFYTTSIQEFDKNGPVIKGDELKARILKELRGHRKESMGVYIADEDYFCTTKKVAKSIIRDARISKRDKLGDQFDCDDFAHMLKAAFIDDIYYNRTRSKAYAFGVVWGKYARGGGHAANFIITSDGKKNDFKFFIVDPQTAKWYSPGDKYLTEIELAIC